MKKGSSVIKESSRMARLRRENAEIVDEFSEQFRKRRKALGRRFSEMDAQRIVERIEGVDRDKIEITLRRRAKAPNSLTFRLYIWPDRWVWLDVREGGKQGWAVAFTREGRLSGQGSAALVLELVERTYDALVSNGVVTEASPFSEWDRVLLRGPLVVV